MKQHVLRGGAVRFEFVGEQSPHESGELLEAVAGKNVATHNHPATAKT